MCSVYMVLVIHILEKKITIKKIVRFTTQKSVIHDFRARSSENSLIYDAEMSYTQFSDALK